MSEEKEESIVHEVRDDMWWISNAYLGAAMHMVARQFIDEPEVNYLDKDVLVERITYVMRQHCPIVYSYFFSIEGLTILPFGTVKIIIDLVRAERPLFFLGDGKNGTSKIILPN